MNMAFLKAITVIMGIMILVGIAVLGVTMFNRLSTAESTRQVDEPTTITPPSGARLVGAAAFPDGLVLTFERRRPEGGSETLIAIHDVQTGRRIGFFALPEMTAQ
ncbi:MAG: hypothetical protein NXI16_09835 [Alphaproteobacteria bacterium]|nr:hypothetical protein [Alphaproteobacteria bacterium]